MNVTHRMPLFRGSAAFALLLFGFAPVFAADLTIHLEGNGDFTHKTVKYQCDATGAKLGLPAGSFSVEYINGDGNSLAILPVGGKSLIFSNVISGSGARYLAREFTWWEAAGRSISFSSNSIAGKARSVCRRVEGE